MARCSAEEPPLKSVGERLVACHLYDSAAAGLEDRLPAFSRRLA
jgi:hypothetical protein